jgi:hypothetical protein
MFLFVYVFSLIHAAYNSSNLGHASVVPRHNSAEAFYVFLQQTWQAIRGYMITGHEVNVREL